MKLFLFIAAICVAPAAASAAFAPPAGKATSVSATEKVRVADYYKGKKHCRTAGSATICN